MATVCAFFVYLLLITFTSAAAANQVRGDQNVGGVHLFEFHSNSGGMGLGWKVIIGIVIFLIIVYIYVRYRARKYVKKHLLPISNVRALPEPAAACANCEL